MERTKLLQYLIKRVSTTVFEKELFDINDKVVVGLSGGKDSNALLFILKESFPNLDIKGLHINLGFTENDYFKEIREWGKKLNIDIIEIKTNIYEELKKIKNTPCYRCSFLRKKEIYRWTYENGYKNILLGHHKEDVIETLLINILFSSEISSMPYKLKMFNGDLFVIRPMIEIDPKYINKLIKEYNIPVIKNPCPYEKDNIRVEIKRFINRMDKKKRGVRESIFNAPSSIKPSYLHLFDLKD